ncbi:GNAT family N-acetyltransferase [Pseudonocardia sp. T1-2H]|uniref:GNAT family N-acetyltransferase n=1 Tax=Pseudonocardia sp. T1-2H TaxID=3128899 RepID=UPI0040541F04
MVAVTTRRDHGADDCLSQGRSVQYTPRLVLRPITTESVTELVDLHRDPGIAAWYEGPWSSQRAAEFATDMECRWRRDRLGKWLAYERESGHLVGRGGPSRTDAFGGDDGSAHQLRDGGLRVCVDQVACGQPMVRELSCDCLLVGPTAL